MTNAADLTQGGPESGRSVTDGGEAGREYVPIPEARTLHRTFQRGNLPAPALYGISLAAYDKGLVAVMGPSGSEKRMLWYHSRQAHPETTLIARGARDATGREKQPGPNIEGCGR